MHGSFGFRDGVSHPAVQDVDTNPNLGQETVPQGIILLGREGDQTNVPGLVARPWWAVDGSFLCFRYMFQHVPEFDAFLKRNALPIFPIDPSAPQDLGSELLGARLVGRWKSGTSSFLRSPGSLATQN
jgi:deferrochelatase/peroxidase EfeB